MNPELRVVFLYLNLRSSEIHLFYEISIGIFSGVRFYYVAGLKARRSVT